MDDLLYKIKLKAKADSNSHFYPTVNEEHIEYAEELLGFELPKVLKKIYCEISNGGIGPGYQLGGLPGGNDCAWGDILESTIELRKNDEYEDGWLPILDWGCNQVTLVDCNDEEMIITWLEGDVRYEDYDLSTFLEKWTDGQVPDIDSGNFIRLDKEL